MLQYEASSWLASLPPEVEAHILNYLRFWDLVALECTSKRFYNLIVPRIWTNVELHRPGLHQQAMFKETFNYDLALRLESRRQYIESIEVTPDFHFRVDQTYVEMAGRFLRIFDPPVDAKFGMINLKHRGLVATRLRSLCIDVDYSFQNCLLVFSQFQNLENLDASFQWPYGGGAWDKSNETFISKRDQLQPLERLRTAHLRGYAPHAFVQWVCHAAEELNDLELAILDRPIGTILAEFGRMNPPPNQSVQVSEADEENIFESDSAFNFDADDSDEEDMDQEMFAPRPLATLLDSDIPSRLISLSTLTLRRPIESAQYDDSDWHSCETYVSVRSDETVLSEWARIIRAVRSTIEHLILDQRPVAEEIESDSTGDSDFLMLYPYGAGYQRFEQVVLPTLLEDAEWPKLKSIRLYGFDVPEHGLKTNYGLSKALDSRSFLPQLRDKFQEAGVDINVGLGRRILFDKDSGQIRQGGDGFGQLCLHDSDEDCY